MSRRTSTIGFVLTTLTALALLLSACSQGGIRLRSGSESMQPCGHGEGEVVAVEEIVELPLDCDQAGLTVAFPDGTQLVAERSGASVGQASMPDDPQYVLINLGLDGLFAATWSGAGELHMWGSPAALDLALDGYRSWYTGDSYTT